MLSLRILLPGGRNKATDCEVGKTSNFTDDDDVFYPLVVVRTKVPKEALRRDDIDNRLLEI